MDNSRRQLLSLITTLLFLSLSFSADALESSSHDLILQRKERIALVLGNNGYAHQELVNPIKDAKGMARVLTDLGFQVDLVLDANWKQMGEAINRFMIRLQSGSVGLFFYAGHGIQIDGENYLIPVDFVPTDEVDAKFTTYPASRVVERMEGKNTRVNIIILDACRNNPFRSFRSSSRGLAIMSSGKGTFIAFATSPGAVADDNPAGANGLFTGYLLEVLRRPGLTLNEIFDEVREQVNSASKGKQVPWTGSNVIGKVILNTSSSTITSESIHTPSSKAPASFTEPSGLPTIPRARTNPTDSAEMVFIPAGKFVMGSNDIALARSAQQVELDGYWIYRYEVTNEQFAKFVEATGYKAEGAWRLHFTPGKEKHPVVGVSWNDAVAYAKWVGGRLPTEAEWEKAARGTDSRSWAWGDKTDKRAANLALRLDDKSAVGSFPQDVSSYGCFDMTGNVREWTASLFAPYSEGEFNRQGMGNGERVVRGGSWRNDLNAARVANRDRGKPHIGDETRGFRCAVSN